VDAVDLAADECGAPHPAMAAARGLAVARLGIRTGRHGMAVDPDRLGKISGGRLGWVTEFGKDILQVPRFPDAAKIESANGL